MKVLVVFDQGLSGLGGVGNLNLPLTIQKGSIGTGMLLTPHFAKVNAQIIATIACGINVFSENEDEVVKKIALMVKKVNPDFVLAGPSFNFKEYSKLCAKLVFKLKEEGFTNACAMMSKENQEIIEEYSSKIDIIKMPKKGETGLNDSFADLCRYIDATKEADKLLAIRKEICYS